jgi:hypothetical protein
MLAVQAARMPAWPSQLHAANERRYGVAAAAAHAGRGSRRMKKSCLFSDVFGNRSFL